MKHYGKCRICGTERNLTFEHIPPQKANNIHPIRLLTTESFIELVTDEERLPWDFEGLQYNSSQKGMGFYSLCETCNNITGHLYGSEYVGFTKEVVHYYKENKESIANASVLTAKLRIKPARFIKQVLSMFCSATPGLIETYPELTNIILDKDRILKDAKFKISMYFLKTPVFKTTVSVAMAFSDGLVRSFYVYESISI